MTRLVDDRALREAYRRGEPDALEAVYLEYAAALFALLRHGFAFESGGRRVLFAGFSEQAELENLVQEIFARAFSERARLAYDGLRPYHNYLFAIARNLVSDLYRKRAREFRELAGDAEPVAEANLGAQQVEDEQLAALVQQFVTDLVPAERAIFEARFREALSVEEAARRLQCSEHAVKSTSQKLRKRFFQALRQHGYLEGYAWHGLGLRRDGLTSLVGVLCAVSARGLT